MRKTFGLAAIVLGLVVLLFFYIYHKKEKWTPEIDILVLKINNINEENAQLILRLKVKNNLPFSFNSDGFYFEISNRNRVLAHTIQTEKIHIAGNRLNKIEFPMYLNRSAIIRSAQNLTLSNNDSIQYTFKLQLYNPKSFYVPDSVTIVSVQKLPTFKFPEIVFEGVETKHLLSRKKRNITVNIRVRNFSNSPIEIVNPQLSVSLNKEKEVISSKYIRRLIIPARSDKVYPIEVKLLAKSLMAHGGKILFRKEDVFLEIELTANLQTNNDLINNCKIRTSIKGDLKSFLTKH